MQRTQTKYEGIIIGISFLIGIGLFFISLLSLLIGPANKLENFDVITQLAIVVAGPLTYITSLCIYPHTNGESYSMIVWQKCYHAVFFAFAMIWMLLSVKALHVILHPLFVHPFFSTASISTIFTITPFWQSIITNILIAVYFGVLGYIEWRLQHNYVATFTIIFGFFFVVVAFETNKIYLLKHSRSEQMEYISTQSNKA